LDYIATADSLPGLGLRHEAWRHLQTMDNLPLDPQVLGASHSAPAGGTDGRMFTRTMDDFEPYEMGANSATAAAPSVGAPTLQSCGYMGLYASAASRYGRSRKAQVCTLESLPDSGHMEEFENSDNEEPQAEQLGKVKFDGAQAQAPDESRGFMINTMDSLPGDRMLYTQTMDDFEAYELGGGSSQTQPVSMAPKVQTLWGQSVPSRYARSRRTHTCTLESLPDHDAEELEDSGDDAPQEEPAGFQMMPQMSAKVVDCEEENAAPDAHNVYERPLVVKNTFLEFGADENLENPEPGKKPRPKHVTYDSLPLMGRDGLKAAAARAQFVGSASAGGGGLYPAPTMEELRAAAAAGFKGTFQ